MYALSTVQGIGIYIYIFWGGKGRGDGRGRVGGKKIWGVEFFFIRKGVGVDKGGGTGGNGGQNGFTFYFLHYEQNTSRLDVIFAVGKEYIKA